TLSGAVQAAVENYAWPGNVRELKNVMSRAIVGCDGQEIDLSHLPPEVAAAAAQTSAPRQPTAAPGQTLPPASRPSLADELRGIERQRILDALEACDGNQTQ